MQFIFCSAKSRSLAIIGNPLICLLGILPWAFAGCDSSGAASGPTATVQGTVTVNGVPLADGDIRFMPLSVNQAAPAQATIKDGKYRIEGAPKGRVTVFLNATRPTGKMRTEHGREFPETEDLIPQQYRDGLPVNIESDNETKDFKL